MSVGSRFFSEFLSTSKPLKVVKEHKDFIFKTQVKGVNKWSFGIPFVKF